MGWQKGVKVETTIKRWKQIICNDFRSCIDERRMMEVNVEVHVLTRMLVLRRPIYVGIV